MVRKGYKALRVINVVVNRILELDDINISETQWETAERICAFLEEAESVTEI